MRKITGIIAVLCFISGLTALLYHPITGWMSHKQMDASIAEFEQSKADTQEPPDIEEEETAAQKNYSDSLAEIQSYNQALYESGQIGLVDAWSYQQPVFDLTKYGLTADIVGVLDIPAIGEKLPVYLGATEENMAKGVAVLGQTSMPVGGENTNCVIAGHRGYGGTPFFREIEELQLGDYVYLTTYWGELTYQVESTAIILPDDIEAVLIQEGRELLTLITCHPYVEATHRYVVYCSAAEDGASEEIPIDEIQNSGQAESGIAHNTVGQPTGDSPSQGRITLEQWLPFLAIPLVILSIVILILPSKKRQSCRGRRKDKNEKHTP